MIDKMALIWTSFTRFQINRDTVGQWEGRGGHLSGGREKHYMLPQLTWRYHSDDPREHSTTICLM